jgi:hypothetical protein
MPKGKNDSDARVMARLDAEGQALLRKARAATGKSTSAVIKAALRLYAGTLSNGTPLEILQRCGVVGAVTGPTHLSETYKQHVDDAAKLAKSRATCWPESVRAQRTCSS